MKVCVCVWSWHSSYLCFFILNR